LRIAGSIAAIERIDRDPSSQAARGRAGEAITSEMKIEAAVVNRFVCAWTAVSALIAGARRPRRGALGVKIELGGGGVRVAVEAC